MVVAVAVAARGLWSVALLVAAMVALLVAAMVGSDGPVAVGPDCACPAVCGFAAREGELAVTAAVFAGASGSSGSRAPRMGAKAPVLRARRAGGRRGRAPRLPRRPFTRPVSTPRRSCGGAAA